MWLIILFCGIAGFFVNFDIVYAEDEGVIDVDLNITPVLEVQIPSSVDLPITPNVEGAFNSADLNIIVGTNSPAGFRLSMEVDNNTLSNTSHPDVPDAKLESITDTTDEPNFPVNKWGYSEDGGDSYLKVATKSNIASVDHAVNAHITNLKIAAKVDITKLSGSYSGTISFVAVTNPLPVTLEQVYASAGKTKLNGYYKMQDMTNEICAATEDDEFGLQLIDTRDNRLYWVAKLADGNCWMTQNLDFNITVDASGNSNVKAADSNVDNDWGASSAYPPVATSTTIPDDWGTTNTKSYDPGDYYWKGIWGDGSDSSAGYSYFSGEFSSDIAEAGAAGSHYHVGNLYSWNAVTAGTGADTADMTNAAGSICPKGWRIHAIRNNVDYSFNNLIAPYGLSSSIKGIDNLTSAPLFYFPAGYYSAGSLRSASNVGYYWTSLNYSNESQLAYRLYFSREYISPNSSTRGWAYGYPVRCVAR